MSHVVIAPLATFREVLSIDKCHIEVRAIMRLLYLINTHSIVLSNQDLPVEAIDISSDTL
jgi:hypothetical protein